MAARPRRSHSAFASLELMCCTVVGGVEWVLGNLFGSGAAGAPGIDRVALTDVGTVVSPACIARVANRSKRNTKPFCSEMRGARAAGAKVTVDKLWSLLSVLQLVLRRLSLVVFLLER